jgi:hypothetical protein
VYLPFCHATALQVNRDAGKMRRSGISVDGRGVAIVAAKLFLNFYGSNGGINLNLFVKLMVVNGGQIQDKIARPRSAIATGRVEAPVKVQPFIFFDRNQIVRRFQLFQFEVVGDSRQIEPIDFFILSDQGVVRRAEHRIPEQPAQPVQVQGAKNSVAVCSLDGKSVAGSSGNKQNGNDQERRLAAGQPV